MLYWCTEIIMLYCTSVYCQTASTLNINILCSQYIQLLTSQLTKEEENNEGIYRGISEDPAASQSLLYYQVLTYTLSLSEIPPAIR